MKETFKGRLAWKKKHYSQPVTSTPVRRSNRTKRAVLSENSENIPAETSTPYEYDATADDENDYSVCFSPIQKLSRQKKPDEVIVVDPHGEKKFRFNDLLEKCGDKDVGDDELHVNRDAIKVTYSKSRTRGQKPMPFVDMVMKAKEDADQPSKKSKRTKKEVAGKPKKEKKEKPNKELEKWLAEKNKEFDEVDKTQLIVI